MSRRLRNTTRLSIYFAGLTAIAACVDPFPLDSKPGASGVSGSSFAGSGGTAGAGGGIGSGGSSGSSSGGNGGAGPSAGSSGSGGAGGASPTGGAAGTGGAAPRDASVGTGGSSGAGGGVDAGVIRPDGGQAGTMVRDAAVEARVPREAGPPLQVPPIVTCPPDPPIPDGGELSCPADLRTIANWFPVTPPMDANGGCRPLPHPEGECRFYEHSWHEFLIATQPDAQGRPAFLSWNTIENTFGPHEGEPTPAIPYIGAGVTQAGGRQVVIDQNGHAVYYGMHMNPSFVAFVRANGLTTANGILAADPNLAFPTTLAMVETKEAWTVVTGPVPANFITTPAMVPTLHIDPVTNQVIIDEANPRMVTLQLIAIHIVHTIGGHPEFIWSTFEHVTPAGISDVAPSGPGLTTPPNTRVSPTGHILYGANTTAANANRGVLTPVLNDATQTFTTPPTSIYREFAGSKSKDPAIDDDVAATNDAMTARFTTRPLPGPLDKRPNYRLVGAIWQDLPDRTFQLNRTLVNDENDPDIRVLGSDSANSITGGEDRLSSTAMESFTQATAQFPNCFSCHDAQATSDNGTPQVRSRLPQLTKAGKINVSHIFSEVVRLKLN